MSNRKLRRDFTSRNIFVAFFFFFFFAFISWEARTFGNLSSKDGNANGNITRKYKYKLALLVLRDYSNSSNLHNVRNESKN